MQTKNLCIIPARGGSKRIPRKNVKPFLGKPMLAYSIETAQKTGLFDEIMVSTDDDEIAEAVSCASFFSEIYIDELVVKDEYRGKGIGTQLIRAVEECFSGKGFTNINLCTNGFQASDFYERCGFELEFTRENKSDPRLNKYYYIKYLG